MVVLVKEAKVLGENQPTCRKVTDKFYKINLNQVHICRNQTHNFIDDKYIGIDYIGRCKLPYNHGHDGCSYNININIVDTYSFEMEYNLISIFYKVLPHTSYIIIITLLSLNIYKHVCDKYKQTNNCVYEKKKKKRTNIMSYLCRNKTSVLSSNDRFK